LPVELLEPLVKLFPSLLTKHRCETLDQLKGLGNEQVHLAKPREIVILPVEALLFRRGHPMGNLQSRWKTFGWNLEGRLFREVYLLERSRLVFAFPKLSNEPHDGLI